MIIYKRGDRILPSNRDSRFAWNGAPSALALKKYWRLLPSGAVDPACKPYEHRWMIEQHHADQPDLGKYRVEVERVGRRKNLPVGVLNLAQQLSESLPREIEVDFLWLLQTQTNSLPDDLIHQYLSWQVAAPSAPTAKDKIKKFLELISVDPLILFLGMDK